MSKLTSDYVFEKFLKEWKEKITNAAKTNPNSTSTKLVQSPNTKFKTAGSGL